MKHFYVGSSGSSVSNLVRLNRRGFLGLIPVVAATFIGSRGALGESARAECKPEPAADAKLVWLVDDDEWLREMYEMALGQFGYRTRSFADRADAVGELRSTEEAPGLITTDFVGHRLEVGLFMQQCRAAHPETRILMITGCPLMCLEGCEAQPDGFLQKPFDLEGLQQAVRTVMTKPAREGVTFFEQELGA